MSQKIRTQLLFIQSSLVIPILIFVFQLYKTQKDNIDFTQKEIAGVIVQAPLLDSFFGLVERQNISTEFLFDNKIAPNKALVGLDESSLSPSDFDKLLVGGKDPLDLKKNKTWKDLDQAKSDLSKIEPSNRAAVANLLKILAIHVNDGSNLTLDPDLDTYYIMDAVGLALPDLLNNGVYRFSRKNLIKVRAVV